MDRRQMLKTGAAGVALACLAGTRSLLAAGAGASPEDARLLTLLERLMAQGLDRSPETVTSLGLDKGARAGAKSRLDDRSIAAWRADKARNSAQLAALDAIDRAALSPLGRTNYDSVRHGIAVQEEMNRDLPYIGSPYVLSQLTGAYQAVPDFLDSQHSIEGHDDAEAYLARLEAFALALDQECGQARHDAALGVVPPDFILEKALSQLKALRRSIAWGWRWWRSRARKSTLFCARRAGAPARWASGCGRSMPIPPRFTPTPRRARRNCWPI